MCPFSLLIPSGELKGGGWKREVVEKRGVGGGVELGLRGLAGQKGVGSRRGTRQVGMVSSVPSSISPILWRILEGFRKRDADAGAAGSLGFDLEFVDAREIFGED